MASSHPTYHGNLNIHAFIFSKILLMMNVKNDQTSTSFPLLQVPIMLSTEFFPAFKKNECENRLVFLSEVVYILEDILRKPIYL